MHIPATSALVTLSIAASLAGACGGTQPSDEAPPTNTATPAPTPPTLQGPYGVYVTNEISGDLSVIDPATHTVVATLPLGKRPRGIRVHLRPLAAVAGEEEVAVWPIGSLKRRPEAAVR